MFLVSGYLIDDGVAAEAVDVSFGRVVGGAVVDPAAAHQAALDERVLQLCRRYMGDVGQGIASHALGSTAELSHFATNPVPRPPTAAQPGAIYAIGATSWGQALASGLGANSRYYHELCTWAPLTSYLFDATATFYQLLSSPDFPAQSSADSNSMLGDSIRNASVACCSESVLFHFGISKK